MSISTAPDLYYDPYDVDIYADPYPVFRRLRDETPLYYNERYDFYALSRFDDVEKAFVDPKTFSSAKGDILEAIKADIDVPTGVFIWEDPPLHSAHRGILSRVFTPKKMYALEDQVRRFCGDLLDPLVGSDGFDFVADLGARMPMRVIGMLLGIPEADQQTVRRRGDKRLHREAGKPQEFSKDSEFGDEGFAGYIDWRANNPSDDLMTELLQAEFDDPSGERRRLTREEVLIFISILATAGNETTNRTIGWTGKILGEHPDQRRELAANPDLVPNAVEEILRLEPPGFQNCRYVTRDVEFHGRTVPAGSALMLLNASANHDERAFPPDGDAFDIHREIGHHLTFGYGIHFCLGAALARLEARIALEEVVKRFPDWDVDFDHAEMDTAAVRGWKTLPVVLP